MAASLYIFWRSHVNLRHNWSPSLQISQEQTLITDGIYTYIRHPMYAAELLFCLGQLLLLPNWIAGLSGLFSFLLLYCVRVPQEEKMMEEAFGNAYVQYKKRTEAIIPRISIVKQKMN